MKISFIFSFLLLIINKEIGFCSDNRIYPEVGKAMPNFTLRNIEYFSKKSASLENFKGKWLVLDFWYKGCSGCVSSFPKINEEMMIYSDKVQFMLIGLEDPENKIRKMYAKFRQRENLKMPCAFDSVLVKKINPTGYPYILVIDPMGIVRGITSILTIDILQDYLLGKNPETLKNNRFDEKVDWKSDSFSYLKVNKDTNLLYNSLLAKYSNRFRPIQKIEIDNGSNEFEVAKVSLINLYQFAYFGRCWWKSNDSAYNTIFKFPILNLRDSSLFRSNLDGPSSDNLFCYDLVVSKKDLIRESLMRFMQKDLSLFFGYTAKIETRKMQYWRLVATKKARIKLKTKSNSFYFKAPIPNIGFVAKNYPIWALIQTLWSHFQDEPPFVDETCIQGNIDIKLDAIMTNFAQVKVGLKKNGLDLIKGEKEMKVLVISDY